MGGRVFDVIVRGTHCALDDYDVLAHTTDRFVALTVPIDDIDVADGVLNIEFVNVESFANVRGIEVLVGDVADTIAPVISLLGDDPMTIEAGSTFTDPGAQVTDNVDPTVTISGVSTVNSSVPGDYSVTYNHSDAAGNPAATVVRTVHVVDTTAPVITLVGSAEMTVEAGDTFTDPGATASDTVDGDLSGSIATGGDTVDTLVPGDYVITYNVSDAAGNDADEKTRTVHVVDTTAPVITLLGDNPLSVLQGTVFTDPGATATDIVDGDLSSAILIGGDTVNTAVAGDYVVTYDVSDNAGNDAAQVSRTVTVTADLPPKITLLGDNPQIVEMGDAYVEAGATASDFEDGDLTSSIVVDASAVNTAVVGDYSVAYSVTDSYGNLATATRTVQVVDTSVPPPVDTFVDDDDSVFEADIEWLAAQGITQGL